MEKLLDNVKKDSFRIRKVERKKKKTFPPLLYDLTELQRDANKKFGFSAKETLNIMQRLYENHKVLTYPRTDSRYLTEDVVATIPERLEACGTGPYRKLAAQVRGKKLEPKSLSFVNNSKVSDHHAIIPTEQFVDLPRMSNEERKIYDLVVRRFLSVLYPPCEYEETTLVAECAGEEFVARGDVIISLGFREVYENPEEEETGSELKSQLLPQLKEGDVMEMVQFSLKKEKLHRHRTLRKPLCFQRWKIR